MLRKIFIILFILFLCPLTIRVAAGAEVRLHTGNFDPQIGNSLEIIQALTDTKNVEKYYILQFSGPVQESWKTQVESCGVRLFSYVPDFAFIARISTNMLPYLYKLSCVQAITELPAEAKISLAAYKKSAEGSGIKCDFVVRIFEDESISNVQSKIKDLGGIVSAVNSVGSSSYCNVSVLGGKILELAEIDGIRWIDVPAAITFKNNSAGRITGTRSVWADYGYYGEGQIVAVLDSGLCSGDVNNMHPDFSDGKGGSRIAALVAAPFNKVGLVYNAVHGTHVAGTVLGNGIMSEADPAKNIFPDSCKAGIAPKASLVFQVGGGGQGTTTAEEFVATYEQAWNFNARIATTSLGFTGYLFANLLDDYVWGKKDLFAVTAYGNNGGDYNYDGIVDLGSGAVDAGAKNAFSVGASESVHPSILLTWVDTPKATPESSYLKQGGVTNAEPLKSDYIANCTLGVASFSARGPTSDDRYKPDILAPASYVYSTSASGWDSKPYDTMAGTSMAAPQVAGAAALIREYLASEQKITTPSAALIKAILINSAKNMGVGQYGAGKFREVPSVPNNVCGWGVLNLREAISPSSPFIVNYYDEKIAVLATGESKSYNFTVSNSGLPLKAHLVWTDQAGSEAALGKLVNDLDLSLLSPSGKISYPDNARLHRSSEPFYSTSTDGGSDTLGLMNTLLIEIPSLSDSAMGISKLKVSLANPLNVETPFAITVYEQHSNGTFFGFSGSSSVASSGATEVNFSCPIVVPKYSGRQRYLGLSNNGAEVEYATSAKYPATNQRYLRSMRFVPGEGVAKFVVEPTDKKPFQVEIETYEIPVSPDFDRVNNAVGISKSKPETGVWTIKVNGYNVPDGPQPYALVVSGLSGDIPDGVQPIVTKPAFVPDSVVTEKKSIPLDQTDLESQYHLSDSKPLADKFDATMTIAPGAGQQSLASFCYTVDGVDGQKVSSLNLIKLKDDDTTLEFSYSENAVFSDGHWWLSDLAGNVLGLTEFMNFEELYRVNIVVLDNGNFDLNADKNIVRDPSVLTTSSSSSSATSTDSGSSGCVMNPESSAKMDWILFAATVFILLAGRVRKIFQRVRNY